MNARNAASKNRPTVLTGRKDNMSFEMWVAIEGRPVEVYGEAEMDGGGSEAWIASEEGKVRFLQHTLIGSVVIAHSLLIILPARYVGAYNKRSGKVGSQYFNYRRPFPDLKFEYYCDGQCVDAYLLARKDDGQIVMSQGSPVSAGQLRPLLFSKPTLVEQGSSNQIVDDLGIIEVVFDRGAIGRSLGPLQLEEADKQHPDLVGSIGEGPKKALGAVTRLGDIVPVEGGPMTMSDFNTHPGDEEAGYFRMRFRYGPKDLLRAEGHLPAKDPVRADGPGTSKRKAVKLDDEEDVENGREDVKAPHKKNGNTQKIPAETSSELLLEKLRARLKELEEITELKAKIKALEDNLGIKSNTEAGASSKGKGKATCDGRSAKKARNGGT